MDLKINNLGSIKDAAIRLLPGVNLVVGHNGSGKSTLLACAAALASPSDAGAMGLLKKQTSLLVSEGEVSAEISLDGFTLKYPSNRSAGKPTIKPPSPLALGLVDWTSLDKASTAKYMAVLAPGLEVSVQDLLDHLALPDGGVKDAVKAAGTVEAAHSLAKRSATQLKGAWNHITNATYGVRVAEAWKPENWCDTSFEEFGGLLLEASKHHTALIEAKNSAAAYARMQDSLTIGEDPSTIEEQLTKVTEKFNVEKRRLEDKIAPLQMAHKEAAILVGQIKDYEGSIAKYRNEYTNEKNVQPPPKKPCPLCQGELSIIDGEIVDAKTCAHLGPNQKKLDAIKKFGVDAQKTLDGFLNEVKKYPPLEDLKKQYNEVNQELKELIFSYEADKRKIEGKISEIQISNKVNANTRKKLETATQTASPPSDTEIDSAKNEVESIKAKMSAVSIAEEAQDLHQRILLWEKVKLASGDQGLQKDVLESGLGSINTKLSELSDKIELGRELLIDVDGVVTSNGFISARWSGAERKKINIIMQILVAKAEKAEIVIIDEFGVIADPLSKIVMIEMLADQLPEAFILVGLAETSKGIVDALRESCSKVFTMKKGVVL